MFFHSLQLYGTCACIILVYGMQHLQNLTYSQNENFGAAVV